VLTITLHRPDSLNAFDEDMSLRLHAALETGANDDAIRAIVITGAGRAFSAGQDVRELVREERELGPRAVGKQLRERFNPIILMLRTIEKPIIAAINGVTTGAGLGVALAADLRIASETATFVLAPMSIGLIPGVGSTALLPAIIGLSRASELAFTGERIDAKTASDIGLINRVAPAEELLDETSRVARRLCELPTRTIGLTKRAFNRAALPNLAEQLALEAELQEIAAGTDDHREGLAALIDKRAPTFTGR
jgi:2-(1,2-epoxy-1,2-dihydrophenyl)acetyl-CoA isomerase